MTDSRTAEHIDISPQPRSTWTVIVACLGAFLDGYDLVIISGALLFIVPDLHLAPAETGLVGSIVFVGMVIGALLFGRLTDRFGRNTSFVFVLLLFVVGSLVSAFAPTGWVLIVGRLLIGLGIGADLPVSSTLIAESVSAARRGLATGLMQVFWFGGAAFSGLVGIVLYLLLGTQSWRWMLGSAAVIAVVVIVLRSRISESRRWLEARRVSEQLDQTDLRESDNLPIGARRNLSTIWQSKALRATLLFSCLFWFAATIRGAGFNLYTPTLIKEFGLSSVVQSLSLSLLTNVIYTVAILIGVFFVDRGNRRSIILGYWLITTILTAAMLLVASGNAVWLFAMITISLLPVQIMSAGLFPISVESFPTLVRGSAQSLSSAAGKLGGFIAAFLFPVILGGFGFAGLVITLVAFMVVVLVAGLLIRFPDTTGRELEEIEEIEARWAIPK